MNKTINISMFPVLNPDKNGFMRLCNYPKFKKILDNLDNMEISTPLKEKCPNWPWVQTEGVITSDGTNKWYHPEVEVYFNRITKKSICKWVQIVFTKYKDNYYRIENKNPETYDNVEYCDYHEKYIWYIYNVEFFITWSGRFVGIHYIDANGNNGYKTVKISDLYSTAFRYLNDTECQVIENMIGLKPEPYIEVFMIKPEYFDNYELYLKDAKKYGYDEKPFEKGMFEFIPKFFTINKKGQMEGGKSVNVKIVNM